MFASFLHPHRVTRMANTIKNLTSEKRSCRVRVLEFGLEAFLEICIMVAAENVAQVRHCPS